MSIKSRAEDWLDDLETVGGYIAEQADRAIMSVPVPEAVKQSPIIQAAGKVLANPTRQELGTQAVNLAKSASNTLQESFGGDPVDVALNYGPGVMGGTIFGKGIKSELKLATEAYESLKARATSYPTKNTIKDMQEALAKKIEIENKINSVNKEKLTKEFIPRDYMGDDRFIFRIKGNRVGDSLFSVQNIPKQNNPFFNFPELAGQKVGYSNLVGVEQEYQGKGIGKEILKELEQEAKNKGANYFIFTSVLPEAEGFYFKQGYTIDKNKKIAVKKITTSAEDFLDQ